MKIMEQLKKLTIIKRARYLFEGVKLNCSAGMLADFTHD
jgi:hypothetical protein